MIAEEPFSAVNQSSSAFRVGLDSKVPNAGGSSDDKLDSANDECIDPEQAEEEVKEEPSDVFIPHNLGNKWISFSRGWCAHRVEINGGGKPDCVPHKANKGRNGGQEKDFHVGSNILTCRLEDGDAKLQSIEAAADSHSEQPSKAKNHVRSFCDVVVSWILGEIFFSGNEVGVEKSTDKEAESQNDSEVDNDTGSPSDKEQVEVGNQDRDKTADKENFPSCCDVIEVC